MRFLVSRTSLRSRELKPCNEAVQGPFTREDVRTTDDPAKIPMRGGGTEWWYGEGTNHRTIPSPQNKRKQWIVRDFPEIRWFVELATLDDLIKFTARYGECIVGTPFDNSNVLSIEIYDGYRE